MRHVHYFHFLVLLAILAGGVLMFFYVQPNTALQLTVGVVTAAAYVCWGLIHHALQGDLHRKVVVEYMLVGAIAVVLLITVLGF